MRRPATMLALVTAAAIAVLPAISAGAQAAAAQTTAAPTVNAASATQRPLPAHERYACAAAAPGHASCFAVVRTDVHAGLGVRGRAALAKTGNAAALPPGFGPADLASAYKLPAIGGAGQTVAVVDAGDDAAAEADLGVYRSTYGLPPCSTANGCFRKVNESGTASPLPADQGWGVEISLDLDMVSAACPGCHIVLVEANSAMIQDLAASVNTAVAVGATEVSNSYGAAEANGMQAFEAAYSHPGVAITVSSGDFGYGIPNFPAVYSSVIAVGGTTLTTATNARGWKETAWRGAASGCSAWISKPGWQKDRNCPDRMVADVAAVADPQTGLAVYDSNPNDGAGGWTIVGGTSASSPFIAGVIALAGNPQRFPNASYLYSHTKGLYDVIGGNNVFAENCGGDYQCNAVKGYDGPTGNGTPHGITAF